MVYFIVNQKTSVGFRMASKEDMVGIADYTPAFEKDFETYSLDIKINNKGDITISDSGHDDLSEGVKIASTIAYMTESMREKVIDEIARTLYVERLEYGYQFSVPKIKSEYTPFLPLIINDTIKDNCCFTKWVLMGLYGKK